MKINGSFKIVGLIMLCLSQLAVPASMIYGHETTLKKGTLFKFHVAPVDPYDAFRGRYVRIRLQPDSMPKPPHDAWRRHQRVNVVLEQDVDGFAKIKRIAEHPSALEPFIDVRISQIMDKELRFDLPIDRYYMEETLAPKAERVYREQARREKKDAYVTVRVYRGNAVIENLYIGEKPIYDYVNENMQ